jgi:hypothetical protein
VKKFLAQGGPITQVKVSGKSNRLKGVSKVGICSALQSLVEDKNMVWSKSFKNRKEALEYQQKRNLFLLKRIKEYQNL